MSALQIRTMATLVLLITENLVSRCGVLHRHSVYSEFSEYHYIIVITL